SARTDRRSTDRARHRAAPGPEACRAQSLRHARAASEPDADAMRALRPVSGSEFFLVRSSALPQALPIELPAVAVVIPAYRAARTIENVIAGVPSFVRHIVVVDDGSPDETADVVRRACDPTNGYTAIHASLVPLLATASVAKRFFFESSMLLNLSLLRAVVRDVYIPARYANGSHLSESRAAVQFPFQLFRGFLRRVRLE